MIPTIAEAAALRDMLDGTRDRPPNAVTGRMLGQGWVAAHRERIAGSDDWAPRTYTVTADGRAALHRFLLQLHRHGFGPDHEHATLTRLQVTMDAILGSIT